MKNEETTRFCRNKECRKVLPTEYKHIYCEACRNKHAQNTKNVLKGIGTVAATAAGAAVLIATGGKINLKK